MPLGKLEKFKKSNYATFSPPHSFVHATMETLEFVVASCESEFGRRCCSRALSSVQRTTTRGVHKAGHNGTSLYHSLWNPKTRQRWWDWGTIRTMKSRCWISRLRCLPPRGGYAQARRRQQQWERWHHRLPAPRPVGGTEGLE